MIREVLFFAISGILGFVVDTSVLYLLLGSLGLYAGRGVSFVCAVISTWLFNRNLTFKDRTSSLSRRRELLRYFLLMIGGGIVNLGVYSIVVGHFSIAVEHPVIGVVFGSAAGMVINFLTSRLYIFRFSQAASR